MPTPYELNLPCLNPNCRSHGVPHPNCRCYGFSEGGEVNHFCSEARPHKEGCEYYMEGGGEVPATDLPDTAAQSNAVPESDLPDSVTSENEVPSEDLPTDFTTPGQQALTILEGGARGFAGPLATATELGLSKMGVPGLSAEEQAGREAANPIESKVSEYGTMAGSMLTGTGEAGLIAKGIEAIPKLAELSESSRLAQVGVASLKSAMSMGAFQASDEATKGLLGTGDPEAPVSSALAHIGAASLMGGITGGVFNTASQGLQAAADSKIAGNLTSFVTGLGHAVEASKEGATPEEIKYVSDLTKKELEASGLSSAGYAWGQKAGKILSSNILAQGASLYEAYKGYQEGGISEALKRGVFTEALASKWVSPSVIAKLVNSGAIGSVPEASRYVAKCLQGQNTIGKAIDSVFKPGMQQAYDYKASEKDRDKLNKFIEEGGVDKQLQNQLQSNPPPGFAEGGIVDKTPQVSQEPDHLAIALPEQATLLAAAKGRISNYLNTIRPQENAQKLPFDEKPAQTAQKRSYENALDLANQPLSILNKVKDGSLTPENLKHFVGMYPELHNHLSKKLTEKIMQAQMDEEKPSYSTRQGMSLFMGTALDSTFTPQALMTIQGLYAAKQAAQQQAPAKPKKGSSTLSKASESYQTDDQAREKRLQTQKA